MPEPAIHYFQCPACRYDIGTVELERCPECGCVPKEVMAQRKRRYARRWVWWPLWALLGVCGFLGFLMLTM
ncbi:MAG: hypothetical protein AAFV77_03780 [Planctomycetota bacterium]